MKLSQITCNIVAFDAQKKKDQRSRTLKPFSHDFQHAFNLRVSELPHPRVSQSDIARDQQPAKSHTMILQNSIAFQFINYK